MLLFAPRCARCNYSIKAQKFIFFFFFATKIPVVGDPTKNLNVISTRAGTTTHLLAEIVRFSTGGVIYTLVAEQRSVTLQRAECRCRLDLHAAANLQMYFT